MSNDAKIWMPLYIADYLADTGRLSAEQHGAYLLALMDYWRSGPLPDDDEALARITRLPPERWRQQRPAIARFFDIEDGEWRHKRVDEERRKAKENQAMKKERAKKGAAARWEKERTGNASSNAPSNASSNPDAMLDDCPSPSPSPSPSKSTSRGEARAPDAAPPAPKKPTTKKKKTTSESHGTRIPDDFPTDDDLTWSTENFPAIDHNVEAEKFRDYWTSMPGQKGRKADWSATWRNWIRKQAEWQGQRGGAGTGKDQGAASKTWNELVSVITRSKSERMKWLDAHPEYQDAIRAAGGLQQLGLMNDFQLKDARTRFMDALAEVST